MSVEIETYLRSASGDFVLVADVPDYSGDNRHVSGAINFVVDGQHVLDQELWDDVDWLWPYVVQAIDECVTSGHGERYFPDQPVLFRADRCGESRLMLKVEGGPIHRVVSADRREVLAAVAAAALDFFAHLERLIPGTYAVVVQEVERIESWPTAIRG